MKLSVLGVFLRLLMLSGASAVLVLGWAVLDPSLFARTSPGALLQRALTALDHTAPVGRTEWAVPIIALGFGLVLAALPRSVADRSRRAPHSAEIPQNMSVSAEAAAAEEVRLVQPGIENGVAEMGPAPVPEPEQIALSHESSLAAARERYAATGSWQDRSVLADLLKKSGDLEDADGRIGEAISAYEESLALRRQVIDVAPSSAREQRWLWITLEALADCREARSQRSRAASLYREALEAGRKAVALSSDDQTLALHLEETARELQRLDSLLVV